MASQAHKINGVSLTAMVVTTAIGSGIFALSSDLAVAASPGAAMISWFWFFRWVYQRMGLLDVGLVRQRGVCYCIYEYVRVLFPRLSAR